MILTIFIFLTALAVVMFALGFLLDIPLLSIIGAVFIFGLGLLMMGTDIQVKTGTEDVLVYGNNFSGYHWDAYNDSMAPPQTDKNAFLFYTNSSNVYANYDFGGIGTTSFAWLFMILGAFLFAISLINVGGGSDF